MLIKMYRTLKKLPGNGVKPISREAVARCIEADIHDEELAQMVRSDTSFDVAVALVTTSDIDTMRPRLYRFYGEVPLFDRYCGTAIEKIVRQRPYGRGTFGATVRLV